MAMVKNTKLTDYSHFTIYRPSSRLETIPIYGVFLYMVFSAHIVLDLKGERAGAGDLGMGTYHTFRATNSSSRALPETSPAGV